MFCVSCVLVVFVYLGVSVFVLVCVLLLLCCGLLVGCFDLPYFGGFVGLYFAGFVVHGGWLF